MSISEVLALQGLPSGDPQKLFAVEKYLLIPVTLKSAITALKINGDEKYSPALQEKIFRSYLTAIKRPQVKTYITGSSGDVGLSDAQTTLAHEFASVGIRVPAGPCMPEPARTEPLSRQRTPLGLSTMSVTPTLRTCRRA
jgi:hypothetical protein